MPVTEESRHRLHQALDETIGPEEATTLMEHLPPVGWADVATTSDLAQLREHIDQRFAMVDQHFAAAHADVDARFTLVDQRFDARFTLVDQRFDAVDQRFDAVDQRFDAVDRRFDAVDRRFDTLSRQLEAIDGRMGSTAAQLTHQYWQFITTIVAVGVIVIGLLRYT